MPIDPATKAAAAPEAAPAVAVAPPTTAAAVLALGPQDCRWLLGEPGKPGFRFCGGRQAEGSSYCSFHRRASVRREDEQPGRAR